MASSVNYGTQQYFGFDPRTIPGCSLWLDAADSNTFTFSSGSNISAWRDKSSNALSGNAVNSPTQTAGSINGLPAVVFSTGTQYIDYGNNLNLGSNSVYVFSVVKFDSTADGAIIGKSRFATNAGRWSMYRRAVDGGTLMVADVGSGGVAAAYTDTSTTTQLLSGYWDRSVVYIFQNGTQRASNALVNTTSLSSTDSLWVGAYQSSAGGAPPSSGLYLIGKIGEIIVYIGGALTTLQRQQIEGYLAWKWGLNTSILATHPFRYTPNAMRIFQPTDIPGLEFWMDIADPSTLTPAGIVNGQTITGIRDKSGNNRTITIEAGTPTYIANTVGSCGAVNFDGTVRMASTLSNAIGSGNCYSVMVLKPTGSTSTTYVPLTNGSTPNAAIGIFALSAPIATAGLGYADWAQANANINNRPTFNSYAIITANRSNGTITERCIQSVNSPGSTLTFSAGANTYDSNLRIGYLYLNSTFYNVFVGEIGEVLIYNRSITTQQQDMIEAYLANKWGMGPTNLITTSPYYNSTRKILPSTALFTPTSILNCNLWLDASDPTTITTATGVSQWNDKSGNGYNLTQATGASQPTQSGNYIVFASDRYLNIPQASINNVPAYSIFLVINPIASLNWIMVKQRDGVNTYNALSMTNYANAANTAGTSGYLYWHSHNAGTIVNSGSALSTSTPQILELVYDGTNLVMYRNGTQLSSTAASAAIQNDTAATNFTLGAWLISGVIQNSGTTNFQLGELIFYRSSSTLNQRQAVEGYLAWKWGLQTSLPTSHPYRNFLPGANIPSTLYVPTIFAESFENTAIGAGNASYFPPFGSLSWNSWSVTSGSYGGIASGSSAWANSTNAAQDGSYMAFIQCFGGTNSSIGRTVNLTTLTVTLSFWYSYRVGTTVPTSLTVSYAGTTIRTITSFTGSWQQSTTTFTASTLNGQLVFAAAVSGSADSSVTIDNIQIT